MPDNLDITQSLEQLKRELMRLAPAIQQVEAAEAVITSAGNMVGQHEALLAAARGQFEASLQQLHLTAKTTQAEQYEATDAAFMGFRQSLEQLIEYAKQEQATSSAVREDISRYLTKIENFDLPARFNNIDAQMVTLKEGQAAAANQNASQRTLIIILLVIGIIGLALLTFLLL